MSFLLGVFIFAVGLGVGWLLKRPQWFDDLLEKYKLKIR